MPDSPNLLARAGWRVLVISPNQRTVSDLVPLLSQQLPAAPRTDLSDYPNRRDLTEIIRSTNANLCFLDIAASGIKAAAVLIDLIAIDPAIKIVVLLAANDPDLILRCLRQGAAEFLAQPYTAEQLQPVMERLNRLLYDSGAAPGSAKIHCVIPSKGASGATTIASNLAFQWKRYGPKRTLLADLDPLTGTIAFLLKLRSTYSFVDALAHANTMDADLWKGLVSNTNGIDVLLPPENHMDAVHDLKEASPIFHYGRHAYDHIVIDCGSAYGDWNLSLARLADEILLVTTNELPALQAAQRALAHFVRNKISRSKVRIVVNRYNRDLGLSKEMIETALKTEVFHLCSSDYESINRSLIDGKLIGNGSAFGKSLIALADKLAGSEGTVPPVKNGSMFGSLLSKFRKS